MFVRPLLLSCCLYTSNYKTRRGFKFSQLEMSLSFFFPPFIWTSTDIGGLRDSPSRHAPLVQVPPQRQERDILEHVGDQLPYSRQDQ